MFKLRVKDLMMTGVYTALYFAHVAIGTLLAVVILHSGNMLFAPAIIGLISGTVYLVLVNKVHQFGAITLMGIVMSIFFFLSGYFILSFLPSFVCGIVADVIAKQGNYKQKAYNILSYIVFSLGNFGPILFMWVAKEAYIQRLLAKGKDMTYIQNVMVDFDITHILILVICSLVGGLVGQYLIDKHFKKAGLVA